MKILDNREINAEEFVQLLCKLKAPKLLGLAGILEVNMFYSDVKDDNGKPMPRSAESIVEDCMVKFYALNRKKRREILKIMRAEVKS